VLDVKSGNGAFMARRRDAAALATSLVEVANGAGLATSALITDMNQPLASAAGNAVEVANAVAFLTGAARDPRLETVTLALAAEMLVAAGLAETAQMAHQAARLALDSGKAAEVFGRMVAALGGPAGFVENPAAHLPEAPVQRAATAERDGHVAAIETRAIGLAVVALGGGRTRPGDAVDHSVGLRQLAPVGAPVGKGDPLAIVHARSAADAEAAIRDVRAAYHLADAPPPAGKPVLRRIPS
jgi:thymidine phosphorylase